MTKLAWSSDAVRRRTTVGRLDASYSSVVNVKRAELEEASRACGNTKRTVVSQALAASRAGRGCVCIERRYINNQVVPGKAARLGDRDRRTAGEAAS